MTAMINRLFVNNRLGFKEEMARVDIDVESDPCLFLYYGLHRLSSVCMSVMSHVLTTWTHTCMPLIKLATSCIQYLTRYRASALHIVTLCICSLLCNLDRSMFCNTGKSAGNQQTTFALVHGCCLPLSHLSLPHIWCLLHTHLRLDIFANFQFNSFSFGSRQLFCKQCL